MSNLFPWIPRLNPKETMKPNRVWKVLQLMNQCKNYESTRYIRMKTQQKDRFHWPNLLHISIIWRKQKMGLRRISRLDIIVTCFNVSYQADENVLSGTATPYIYIYIYIYSPKFTKTNSCLNNIGEYQLLWATFATRRGYPKITNIS